MQILFHIGAHCTDGGLLIRSVLRNRGTLAAEGISVPGPGRYRELLGEVSTTLRGAPASAETEAMLIEAICDDDTAQRVVLSNENFLCRPRTAISAEGLYPKAGKSAWLRNCFPGHEVEFALALRSPASFVPALLDTLGEEERAEALAGLRIDRLFWSEVVDEIAHANPGCRIIAWRHEDTPFVWEQLLRELTGADPYTALEGGLDMAEQVIAPTGLARLREFLAAHDGITETRRRAAIAAFLDAHPAPPPDIAQPEGWTEGVAARLGEAYDEDVALIAAMPGVTFLDA